jgi:hypothetical protein
MMHKPEKPDSVVVAVKPANKVEQSAAELVMRVRYPGPWS